MRPLAVAVSLLLSIPPMLGAQDTQGSLNGIVRDSAGAPISAAEVAVSGPALQGTRGAVTGEDGAFLVPALPVGTYGVEIARLGYQGLTLTDVIVRLGRTTTVGEVTLTESPVPLPSIEARARRLLIDPVSSAGGVNLTPRAVRRPAGQQGLPGVAPPSPAGEHQLPGRRAHHGGRYGHGEPLFRGGSTTSPTRCAGSTRSIFPTTSSGKSR